MFLHVKRYSCIQERRFKTEALNDHHDFLEEFGCMGWMTLNNIIKESERTIVLELYDNAHNKDTGQFVSSMMGKIVNYSGVAINGLMGFQAPHECGIQKRTLPGNILSNIEWNQILKELCHS